MSLMEFNKITWIADNNDQLVDLTVQGEALDELKAYASQLPSIQISPRSVCDLELLAVGAYSPLDRFISSENHQRVLDEMRLVSGQIFPIPITLPLEPGADLHLDQDIALRNKEYELLAIMTIEEIYSWDRTEVAGKVFGTQDLRHPLVNEMQNWGASNISGNMKILNLPRHFDFQEMRLTPLKTRTKLAGLGQQKVIAYQPSFDLIRFNDIEIKNFLESEGGILLLQIAAGMARPGDVDHYTRTIFFRAFAERYFKPDQVILSLLPLASRMAGPREALWHAVIHRNYGANHMIVSRNHASPGNSSEDGAFFNQYEAQALVEKYGQELGIAMLPEHSDFEDTSRESQGKATAVLSCKPVAQENGKNGKTLPAWFVEEETRVLASALAPRHKQGVCIWFTGFSGSGKSTTAEMLAWLLLEHGRRVTVLDGDIVRTHLSKGLGFSKDDRNTNVRRIGFVASELVRLGGTVICAVVSPFRLARNDVRNMLGKGQYVEVFVNTPLEVCEARDVKGMYAKARRGELKGFTGIDDPYEPPDQPEITLDTIHYTPQENANFIIDYLIKQGFIRERKRSLHAKHEGNV